MLLHGCAVGELRGSNEISSADSDETVGIRISKLSQGSQKARGKATAREFCEKLSFSVAHVRQATFAASLAGY